MAKPRKWGASRDTSVLRISVSRAEESSEGSGSEGIDGKSEGN